MSEAKSREYTVLQRKKFHARATLASAELARCAFKKVIMGISVAFYRKIILYYLINSNVMRMMMDNQIFSYPLLIKEAYLDTFGHVNNAAYLTVLEEARWEFITKNGYGLKKIQASGLGPTILEIKLSFLKELHLRDEILIETQLLSYEKKIGKLIQKMKRSDDTCCIAELTFGLFDLKQRKLILPTPEWLQAIGASHSDA